MSRIDVCDPEELARFMSQSKIDLSKIVIPEGHFIPVKTSCCGPVIPYFPPKTEMPPVPIPAAGGLMVSALITMVLWKAVRR